MEPGGLVDSDWPFVLFHCSLFVTQGRVGNKIWGRGWLARRFIRGPLVDWWAPILISL